MLLLDEVSMQGGLHAGTPAMDKVVRAELVFVYMNHFRLIAFLQSCCGGQ